MYLQYAKPPNDTTPMSECTPATKIPAITPVGESINCGANKRLKCWGPLLWLGAFRLCFLRYPQARERRSGLLSFSLLVSDQQTLILALVLVFLILVLTDWSHKFPLVPIIDSSFAIWWHADIAPILMAWLLYVLRSLGCCILFVFQFCPVTQGWKAMKTCYRSSNQSSWRNVVSPSRCSYKLQVKQHINKDREDTMCTLWYKVVDNEEKFAIYFRYRTLIFEITGKVRCRVGQSFTAIKKKLSCRKRTVQLLRVAVGTVRAKYNWKTIFFGHYWSVFNQWDIIVLQRHRILWNNAK